MLDGNESIASESADVTPSSSLAGPTEMNGGVIATDTIWLSSRSPYMIGNNMLIRENGSLLLMAGTAVQFEGANKHILVKGYIQAYGSENNRVSILSDPSSSDYENQSSIIYGRFYNEDTFDYRTNPLNSNFYYTDVGYINIYVESESNYGRNNEPANITLEYGELKLRYPVNGESSAFAIKDASNTAITIEDCLNHYSSPALVGRILNSTISILAGKTCSTQDVGYSGDSILQYAGYGLKAQEIVGTSVNDINLYVMLSLNDTVLNSSNVFNYGNLRARDLELTNSQIALQGDNSKLRLNHSILDANSTVSAKYLDVASNYWGTVSFSNIAERTNYFPEPLNDTHLYPIITSSDLDNADWDNDGIPDIRDHDNDNDGYSDLQEDWASDPAYGSIYNPLDNTSYPDGAIDTDMDGIADVTDTDDDNDNLSDTEEATHGTNHLLADTDNDGSLDGDEISRKYDPLDGANYPYLGTVNGVTIDGTNVNDDGVVYFAGETVTLNNVTVAPGVKLMVDRDTQLRFNDSSLLANQNSPIFIRASGSGSGFVTINNSQLAYTNIKLAITLELGSTSTLTRSDVHTSASFSNYGLISHSLIQNERNVYVSESGLLDHVYVIANDSVGISGEMRDSRQVGTLSIYSYQTGVISHSVMDYLVTGSGKVQNSIANKFSGSNDPSLITDSDVALHEYGATWNNLFNGTYITNMVGSAFYDGLGSPIDTIGDGVADTEFTLGGQTYLVDSIKNPRSTPNFPNGESDLWDPNGVGCLWDKNDPNTFPDPLAP